MTPIMLDSVIGIVILLSTVIAFYRGFVKEVLTIVTLTGAAGASYFFGPHLKPSYNGWLDVTPPVEQGVVDVSAAAEAAQKAALIWGIVPPEIMASFLAYATAFFGVFLVLTLASISISNMVKAMGLTPLDRGLGSAFGAARGFLLVLLVYLPFSMLMDHEKYPEWVKKSISVVVLEDTVQWGNKFLEEKTPEELELQAKIEEEDQNSLRVRMSKLARDMKKENSNVRQEYRTSIEPAAGEYGR